MTTFYLCADEKYFSEYIDFSSPDDITIPVVPLQTGGGRTSTSPGVYRGPHIRTYADKFGTPTTLTTPKEITFPAVIYGQNMDEIYYKFQQINSYLDRAQIAASPWGRGSGVVFIEQLNDAAEITVWDVISGVITDVDFNLPGIDIAAAVIQLTVLPFSRGRPNYTALGSTLTNGTNASFFVPYLGRGDAEGLFELRLKDTSAGGHAISWVAIGRRSYPQMASTDFTPWYAQSATLTTTPSWQLLLTQVSAAGKHQTGLFGAYAIVNDASPVVIPPSNILGQTTLGAGSIPNGFLTSVLAPTGSDGNYGETSSRLVTVINNSAQPGNVQDQEGFEQGNFNNFATQPTLVVPGSGTASVTVDATAAIVGQLGAHFKVVGDTTASSLTTATIGRFMPALSGLGTQSISYKLKPVSWGSWATTTGQVTPPVSGPTSTPSYALSAPSAPVFTNSSTFGWISRFEQAGITWINSLGETTMSPLTGLAGNGTYPQITIPAFPAGAIACRIYYGLDGYYPVALDHDNTADPGPGDDGTVEAAGTYLMQPKIDGSRITNPPSTNTTGATTFPAGTYDFGFTWLTAVGETTISPLTAVTLSSAGSVAVTIPSFPATVTGARIYASHGTSGTTVTLAATVSSPGAVTVNQGNGTNLPPASNTSGVTSGGGTDRTPRFTWGSLTIYPTGAQNIFACKIGTTQIGSAFSLAPGIVHEFGATFQQVGTQVVYSLILDGTLIGSLSGAIGVLFIPVTASWSAVGFGTGGAFTEEYYLDEIHVYDSLLQPGFNTSGASITLSWVNGTSTSTVDLFFTLETTGQTTAQEWYKVTGVSSPYILSSATPFGALLVSGPPTVSPSVSYAQLKASVGVGAAPVRFMDKPVVRTKLGHGVDELVRIGTIELPPGSKAEYRDLDGWSMQVWVKSGSISGSAVTVKGLVLFPEDEDGWAGITASAFAHGITNAVWHIGTNRWGRSYAQLFDSTDIILQGYADVTGAIGIAPGDNTFVVLTGRDDGSGNLLMDLSQTFQIGYQAIPRNHFQITELAIA